MKFAHIVFVSLNLFQFAFCCLGLAEKVISEKLWIGFAEGDRVAKLLEGTSIFKIRFRLFATVVDLGDMRVAGYVSRFDF